MAKRNKVMNATILLLFGFFAFEFQDFDLSRILAPEENIANKMQYNVIELNACCK
jgi:hypothetical protein